jgi:hypothetical protein
VWIGGGAIILPGVSIGDDAVIGAGSVVTRDVPRRATAFGNPARVRESGSRTRCVDFDGAACLGGEAFGDARLRSDARDIWRSNRFFADLGRSQFLAAAAARS